jgi:peptidoglycan/xylan/chitin deacetylase (PgdA/CDA1 family)
MIGRGRPVVLCYHAVSGTWTHRLSLPPEQIVRQVRSVLARGYRGGTAAETLKGSGRLLHVTFDDAFRSIALVLPELARLHVPVTVFACTGYADTGAPLAIPELATTDQDDLAGLATMAWNELRAVVETGVEVGSHTISHPHLPELSDDELDRQLRASRDQIESELGVPCALLAYPYGEHDTRVQAAVRAAGYAAAYSLDGPTGNRFAVPRVDLFREDGILRTSVKTTPTARRLAQWIRRTRPAAAEG